MTALFLALVVFAVVHVAPSYSPLKKTLKQQMGKGFGPAYGILSLLGLVLLIWTFRTAVRTPLYDPPSWGIHANYALTLIAFIFLGIFLFRGSWRQKFAYPLAIAILFWGAGHLLANGDDTTTLLIGGLIILAVAQVLLSRASKPAQFEPREGHNLLSVLAGIALYGVMTQLHTALIGVPVFQLH